MKKIIANAPLCVLSWSYKTKVYYYNSMVLLCIAAAEYKEQFLYAAIDQHIANIEIVVYLLGC